MGDGKVAEHSDFPANGRLQARPGASFSGTMGPGFRQLNIDRIGARDGKVYVPSTYSKDHPAPLVVFLHGNRWNAEMGFLRFQAEADRTGTIFLFPESRLRTWDRIINHEFGPDVTYLDQALKIVFRELAIDMKRVALAGFSDGASDA